QHVRPHPLQSLAIRNKRLKRRHRDCLVLAFLPEHVQKHSSRWSAVRVPVEVYHVVEIAGACAFSERTQFFSEGLLIGVAICPDTALRAVAVRMKYLAKDGAKDELLVRRQVEFDLGPAT